MRCLHCNYDLCGLPVADDYIVCPECGAMCVLPFPDVSVMSARAWRMWLYLAVFPGIADFLLLLVLGIRDGWWSHFEVSRVQDRVLYTSLLWPLAVATSMAFWSMVRHHARARSSIRAGLTLDAMCLGIIWLLRLPLELLPPWYRC
jgi:hypothetical protein